MGRRIPLLISTLILLTSFIAAPSVSAKEIVINDVTYWSYNETLTEANKLLEHRKTICNGNYECEEYLGAAYIIGGGKYGAARSFIDQYFMITAVDPEASSIKVFFQDYAAGNFMGDRGKDVLKELYLFWWENGWPGVEKEVYKGETNDPNRREIYTYKAEENREEFPTNIEVEIPVSKAVIEALKTRPIYWGAESEMSNAYSADRYFGDCLTEIEGSKNYECRAVFDEFGNILYVPTEKISTSDMGVPATPLKETIKTEPKEVIAFKTTTKTESLGSADTMVEPKEESTKPQQAAEYVEVPLAANNEEHEFPWWLIVFIFSGIFLILWWFIPLPERKKMKKTLDK